MRCGKNLQGGPKHWEPILDQRLGEKEKAPEKESLLRLCRAIPYGAIVSKAEFLLRGTFQKKSCLNLVTVVLVIVKKCSFAPEAVSGGPSSARACIAIRGKN